MEVIDENFMKEDTLTLKEQWEEIKTICLELEKYDLKTRTYFIKNNLKDEVEEIKKQFDNDFKDIPDTDILKLEVLSLLGKLGINIYI